MSFLNLVLLGGAAAFSLPLLIHLLNRSRFKMVDWGAMHLLESALQSNSKRVQWQSLLLLFLRCLIPILLALALARPVLTKWRLAGSSGGDKSLVLLIDNSFSMNRASATGGSCFDAALKSAAEIVGKQSATTEMSVWAIGGKPTDVLAGTTFDRRRALMKLQSIRGGAGSVPVQAALAAGLKQSQQMQNANREIIVISDFQGRDWNSFTESDQQGWKARVGSESIRPQLTLMQIEASSVETVNLSVALDQSELPLIVAGQSFPIAAQVVNHSGTSVTDVAVVLQVGGAELASRRISIPAFGKTQAVFACQIEVPGLHPVEIRVEDSAGLKEDNSVYRIVEVREAVRVLLVDSQPDAPVLKRTTGYLSLALSPFQANESTKNYAITHTISPNQVKPQILDEHDVVILSDIQRLDNQAADAIAAFVQNGGGLLFFPGNSTDLNWFNSQWGLQSKSPVLPATLASQSKSTDAPSADGKPSAENVLKIQNSQIVHPALKEFTRPGAGELSSVEIRRWTALQLDPQQTDSKTEDGKSVSQNLSKSTSAQKVGDNAQEESAMVLLRFENNDPMLVTKNYGRGKVLQFATAVDDTWSNFPLRPAFVPMMQGLVQWLALSVDVPHNVVTGETIALVVPSAQVDTLSASKNSESANLESANLEAGKPGGTKLTSLDATLVAPGQEPMTITLAASGPTTFDHTAYPGIYRLNRNGDEQASTLYAVNVHEGESDIRTLDTRQLKEFAASMEANLTATPTSYFAQEKLRNNGRELWRMLMLALVAFLFVELWLQQRISRGGA
jgi:uncharacterized membrane protein